jgi:hypothetical protein
VQGQATAWQGKTVDGAGSATAMVATSLEKLDPSTSRCAPALEPSEGEQDERYDERTDRVLHGDVSGARLEPREKRGKATRWYEPVHGGDGEEEDAKKSGDQRQGSVHRADVREDRKFSVTPPPEDTARPGREALPTFGLVNSRPGTFRAAPSQSVANEKCDRAARFSAVAECRVGHWESQRIRCPQPPKLL